MLLVVLLCAKEALEGLDEDEAVGFVAHRSGLRMDRFRCISGAFWTNTQLPSTDAGGGEVLALAVGVEPHRRHVLPRLRTVLPSKPQDEIDDVRKGRAFWVEFDLDALRVVADGPVRRPTIPAPGVPHDSAQTVVLVVQQRFGTPESADRDGGHLEALVKGVGDVERARVARGRWRKPEGSQALGVLHQRPRFEQPSRHPALVDSQPRHGVLAAAARVADDCAASREGRDDLAFERDARSHDQPPLGSDRVVPLHDDAGALACCCHAGLGNLFASPGASRDPRGTGTLVSPPWKKEEPPLLPRHDAAS